jgi:integrase
MKQVISIANVAAQSGKPIMADNLAAERLRTKVAQYYGLAVTCALFHNGMHLANPCRKVRRLDEDNQRMRVLSDEEEQRLMAALSGRRAHLRPVVQLAIHTMLRRSELLSLRWQNMDFSGGVIRVVNSQGEKTKSKRGRLVPMNSVARELLSDLRKKSEGDYVFMNKETGGPVTEVKTAFNNACAEAGIKNLTFHDLRRTGATRLGEAGADAFYIAAILGHSDVRTSQIYTVATNEGMRRAMESLTRRAEEGPHKIPTKSEQPQLAAAVNA